MNHANSDASELWKICIWSNMSRDRDDGFGHPVNSQDALDGSENLRTIRNARLNCVFPGTHVTILVMTKMSSPRDHTVDTEDTSIKAEELDGYL